MGKHVLSFLSMKAWHPATQKNQKRKVDSEQQYIKAKKAQEQYAKQYRLEKAELEEKRRLEEEKEWRRKQIENRERERAAYQKRIAGATPKDTTSTTGTAAPQKKKSRRGRRKKKSAATKQAVDILASMGAVANKNNCDFMYVAPPGLQEAHDKERHNEESEKSRAEQEKQKQIQEQERRRRKHMNDEKMKLQEDTLLVQCEQCHMYGHRTGSEQCPLSQTGDATVKRED